MLEFGTLVPSLFDLFSGAYQIGVLVSYALFGVTTTQTYIYYSRFPDDSLKLKTLVCGTIKHKGYHLTSYIGCLRLVRSFAVNTHTHCIVNLHL
jgi:hypothetical protein